MYLDTGFVLALELARDQHHQDALNFWKSLATSPVRLVTSSYVVCEVVTFLKSRGHHDEAVRVGTWLLHSPDINLIHVDEILFDTGWQYLVAHRDKAYSLTDCVSFVLMGRLGLRSALTFDHHFTQAGFDRLPGA